MNRSFRNLPELNLQPIRRTTIAEQLEQSLLELIITGKIPPGAHLVEQTLSDQWQVSKISIREAMRSLTKAGLVEIIPSKGAFVIQLTLEDILEVYQIRAMLEGMAIRYTMQNLLPEHIQELQDLILKMEAAEESEDHLFGSTLDTQFHHLIMKLSGRKVATQAWEQMSARILMAVYNASNFFPNYELIAERHKDLLKIMLSGDYQAAYDYVNHHISEGASRLLDALGQKAEAKPT